MKGTLLASLAAAMLLATGVDAALLRVSGDNTWQVFIDGEQVAQGADWQKPSVTEFEVEGGRTLVAIYVHDAEPGGAGSGGMLADIILDDETYIGTSDEEGEPEDTWPGWRCDSGDPIADRDDGWEQPNFDDTDWLVPQEYEQFGAGIWGFGAGAMKAVMGDPESVAHWVWCGPNNVEDEVYFRYWIGDGLPVEPQQKLTTRWGSLKTVRPE